MAERGFWTQLPKLWYFSAGNKITEPVSRNGEKSDICLHVREARTVLVVYFFLTGVLLFNTNLGEVQQPVRSWQGRDLAAGRLPWSLCHPRCWRSYKSRKWRRNNTGHTGFGQTSYMRDNPAERKKWIMSTQRHSAKSRNKKTKHKKKTQENWDVSLVWKGSDWLLKRDFTSVPSHFSNLLFPQFCILYLRNN